MFADKIGEIRKPNPAVFYSSKDFLETYLWLYIFKLKCAEKLYYLNLEVKIDMDVHKATERGLIGTVKYHLLQGVKVDEKDSEGNYTSLRE